MHETAAFSTEQCTTPSLFHNFEASQGARSHSLKHYGFQFFFFSMHVTNLPGLSLRICILQAVKYWRWEQPGNRAIIESVDSNVGIAQTRNIWQYIKISLNLKSGELISLYDNILFIFECFHDQQDSQWREKASRKYPTKQQQNGQIVFLSSFFLSFFRWASSVLRQPLALVYARNSSIFYGAVHDPIAFSQLRSLARRT